MLYAARRGLLEVWRLALGPRVAAFHVGVGCVLLRHPHKQRVLLLRPSGVVEELRLSMEYDNAQLYVCRLLPLPSP